VAMVTVLVLMLAMQNKVGPKTVRWREVWWW